jgi:3-phosphoshikimate 1-carboxyvinyltransferase
MDITIHPRSLRGEIQIIPSKSQAHRLLICAAFADKPTQLRCPETNRDIAATVDCLNALGAEVLHTDSGYTVFPAKQIPKQATLNCCESGSTLRFMLPIVGALGVDATFQLAGRLPQRPLSPLWEEMERMGCSLKWLSKDELLVTGQLRAGDYYIDGGVSSQFITGLLFATSLLEGDSTIHITGNLESRPYVDMTRQAMKLFGVDTESFHVKGGQVYHSPESITVEGDWSNGAFWLAAKALGSNLNVLGLNPESAQGDRAVVDILKAMENGMPTVSAKDIPDLVPILSVTAAAKHGAVFTDIRRLRLKESDRVASTIAMIENLGGKAEADENTLKIHGTGLIGGTVDAVNDHRIAMAAAIAATVCKRDVTILGAECVKKSYPKFWEEYARLGGNYEQHIR